MQVAFECPTWMLKDIQPLADYDFILTHLVLSDEKYAEWFRKSENYKILDNSTNELLEPCSIEDIQKASEIVKPDLIVAPDYLGDYLRTQLALFEILKIWTTYEILPVVQGETLKDCTTCLHFIRHLGFDRVAVPYDITLNRESSLEKLGETRPMVVDIANDMGFNRIHLLGFTTLNELWEYRLGFPGHLRWSIDTGKPIMYGMQERSLDAVDRDIQGDPTLVKMDHTPAGFLDSKMAMVYKNIALLRRVTNGIGKF